VIAKIFEEDVNNKSKDPLKKNLQKKGLYLMELLFLMFFLPKILIKKMMYNKNNFWKILVF
jgi:hypothetical protein